jgi:ubiquinone/menaquinone biosynthesis C-methylase UbiE
MDPDADMLAVGRERAARAVIGNVEWVDRSDAELHIDLGPVRPTTCERALRWMDRDRTLG